MLKSLIKKPDFIFCMTILSVAFIFSIFPLLHNGFFPTFDDVQVVRIDRMHSELKSMQFPVRYVNDLGNGGGYFLYNYYSPLVYYIGAGFHFLGFSLVKAAKLVFISGYAVGLLGITILLKRYASWALVGLGGVLFLTASYVGYDVFTRGDLPEFFAIMLLPWFFWSLFKLKEESKLYPIIPAGIIYAGLITTHHITAFIASIFVIIFLLFSQADKKSVMRVVLGLSLGLALSAFYWIPVVFETKYINLIQNSSINSQYLTNFLNPLQVGGLEKINWGFRPPILGPNLFVGAVVGIAYFIQEKKKKGLTLYLIFAFLFSLFLISSASKLLWTNIQFLQYAQFSWRFLTVATLLSVLLIVLFISVLKDKKLKIIASLILICSVFLNLSYLRPSSYNYIAVYKPEDVCASTTWAQEYLPVNVGNCLPKNKKTPIVQTPSGIKISRLIEEKNGRVVNFQTDGKAGEVIIARYYFPSWVATVDGRDSATYPRGKYGLIAISLPQGKHAVSVFIKNTKIQNLGNGVSLISILMLPFLFIYLRIKRGRYESSN